MTIDEAIKHCLEVAEQSEYSAIMFKQKKEASAFLEKAEAEKAENDCKQCAADNIQFAEWLRELQELRCLKADYVIFRAEAKRLLKLALQDLAEADHCGLCKHEPDDIATCQRKPINCFVWRYADEAEKLFKEE